MSRIVSEVEKSGFGMEAIQALFNDLDQRLRVADGLRALGNYQARFGEDSKTTGWYRNHAGLEELGEGLEGIQSALAATWEWIKKALRALIALMKGVFKSRGERIDELGAKITKIGKAIKSGTGMEDVATMSRSQPRQITVEPWMVNLTAGETRVTPASFGRELNALVTTMNGVLGAWLKGLNAVTKVNFDIQGTIFEAEKNQGKANLAEIEATVTRGLSAGLAEASVELGFRPKLMGTYEFVIPDDKTKGAYLSKSGETRLREVSVEDMASSMSAINNGIMGLVNIFGSHGTSSGFMKKLETDIANTEMNMKHHESGGSALQAKYHRQTLQIYRYFTEQYEALQKYVYSVLEAGKRYMMLSFKSGTEELTNDDVLDYTNWGSLF